MAILSVNFVDRSTKLAFNDEYCVELSTSTTIRVFLRTTYSRARRVQFLPESNFGNALDRYNTYCMYHLRKDVRACGLRAASDDSKR